MTIKEAIKMSGTYNPIAIGSTNEAEKMLLSDENVIFAMNANVDICPVANQLKINTFKMGGKQSGVVAITNKKIFFCSSILGNKQTKQMNISDIKSIDDKSNTLAGAAKVRVIGVTEMFVIDISKKLLSTFNTAINSVREQSSNSGQFVQQINIPNNYVNELKELSELRDKNIITTEEFDTKKKQLLGL